MLLTEENRGELVGGLPSLGTGLRIEPALVLGAISPGCQQQCFRGRGVQFRIGCRKQDRTRVIAQICQHLTDAFATRQAGCHNRRRRDNLVGEELPPQQVGAVLDPEKDLFQPFAALVRGLIHQLVEEVQGSVIAERARAKSPHRLIVLHGLPCRIFARRRNGFARVPRSDAPVLGEFIAAGRGWTGPSDAADGRG